MRNDIFAAPRRVPALGRTASVVGILTGCGVRGGVVCCALALSGLVVCDVGVGVLEYVAALAVPDGVALFCRR